MSDATLRRKMGQAGRDETLQWDWKAATSVLRGEMFFYSRMPARAASVPPDRGGSLAWGSLA